MLSTKFGKLIHFFGIIKLYLKIILQIDSCDINCCCDRDCTEEDRQVFFNCDIKTQHSYNRHFCFQKQHVYRNNTVFKVIINSGGLFCIYKENLPKEFYFSQKKVNYLFLKDE